MNLMLTSPQTTLGIQESGTWPKVSGKTGPSKDLDWPAPTVIFPELAQCAFLNYSVDYYLNSNRG